ncbi:MAG TPA: glycosyltransferase [Marinagarivorans sp.]
MFDLDSVPATSNARKTIERGVSGACSTRKIRIAVVSDAAPHRNGVGAYYQDLHQHLKARGGDLLMLCPVIENGKWHGGLTFPLPGDATQKCFMPSPFGLWRKLRAYKPDVVIVPTPGLYGIFGAFLGKRLGVKVIVGFHTWYEKLTEMYWDSWQEKITRGYFGVSNKILFKYADHTVVNSEFMVTAAAEVGAHNIELVGTPVSFDFIHTPLAPSTGRLHKVIFAGRLAAEKNLDAIIAAAQQLPELQFSVAGDGPEKAKIQSAAKTLPNLNYFGWLNRAELLAAVDDHDALVLPSHVESFGTVALEAMAREKLVVVSEHCGIAHWRSLRTGLITIKTSQTLAHTLRQVMVLDESTRLEYARKARICAVELNEWSLDRWRELIDSTLSIVSHEIAS